MEHLQFLYYKNIKMAQGDIEPGDAAVPEEEIIEQVILVCHGENLLWY